MKVECQICKSEADVIGKTCCTGDKHRIECECGGKEVFDGIALCDHCLEVLNHLEHFGYAIHTKPQDEKGHEYALTLEDVAEVEPS